MLDNVGETGRDYPGYVNDEIEKYYNFKTQFMFLQGFCGTPGSLTRNCKFCLKSEYQKHMFNFSQTCIIYALVCVEKAVCAMEC